jgi:hypothetical protein
MLITNVSICAREPAIQSRLLKNKFYPLFPRNIDNNVPSVLEENSHNAHNINYGGIVECDIELEIL